VIDAYIRTHTVSNQSFAVGREE